MMDCDFFLVFEIEDVIGNKILFENDYQYLQLVKIVDMNFNVKQIVFDLLGWVIVMVNFGKGVLDEEDVDDFQDFVLDVSVSDVDDIFFDLIGEVVWCVFGNVESRMIYCINNFVLWKVCQLNDIIIKLGQVLVIEVSFFVLVFFIWISCDFFFCRLECFKIYIIIFYMIGFGVLF